MILGNFSILPLRDGLGREIPGNVLHRLSTPDAWSCHRDYLSPAGRLELVLGGFLILGAGRVVLVDTGAGDVSERLLPEGGIYSAGTLLHSLRGHGFSPEEVTDVCLSHLHWDHIGWASHDGYPTFPNATYYLHQADWDYFITDKYADDGVHSKLAPIVNHIEPITEDRAIIPGLDTLHVPGHTPGSVAYVVSSGNHRAIMLGDAVHSVVQLEERDWRMIYDVDPEAASTVRNKIADDAATNGDLIVGGHFPQLRFGRILVTNGNRRFIPV